MTINLFSLTQLFGKGAYQDATTLVIKKSSLLRLSPQPSNTAESLLVAILITALENFQGTITDENGQNITDENNQPFEIDNSEFFELLKIIKWQPFQIVRNGQKYINNQVIVSIYAPD
jgi:hypothetical protein